jgi:hypothetical protein
MQRELLFRVWDNKAKEFIADGEIMNLSYSIRCNAFMFDNDNYDLNRDCIALQYTGCGIIYEGSIITNTSRNGGKPHIVKWSNKLGGWVGDYGIEYLIAPELNEIRVCGNICQNPELLETAKGSS